MNMETTVVLLMDSSGSMASLGNEPIQGVNDFYKTQKENGDFESTLVFFSSNVGSMILSNINDRAVWTKHYVGKFLREKNVIN